MFITVEMEKFSFIMGVSATNYKSFPDKICFTYQNKVSILEFGTVFNRIRVKIVNIRVTETHDSTKICTWRVVSNVKVFP